MTRLTVYEKSQGEQLAESIHHSLVNRLSIAASISCPVEFASAAVRMACSESCGKCTPCRVGLYQLAKLYNQVLDGVGDDTTVNLIEELSEHIYRSSDCAIGFEAGALSLQAVRAFRDDFSFHVENHDCGSWALEPVPCRGGCPANVDVPAYLALVAAGRYTDAVRVVRKDNPLAIICGLICEHPCESYCRRGLVDAPINIRGIKRFAADHMESDYAPQKYDSTGKRVAVVGGGPAGLTAAYFLALMGHEPTIYEQRDQLGGMLRYGIPSYRLPHEELDREINWLLAAGITVKTGTRVGDAKPGNSANDGVASADSDAENSAAKVVAVQELKDNYDAVYVAIGAHEASKLGIPGEDAQGVLSAVQLLRTTGSEQYPDFGGKTVCVVGGGNVAMDVARTSLRLGAAKVSIVYRRRRLDMTALEEEIEAAIAEGCELLELVAPLRIEVKDGAVCGLSVQPQMISVIENGRAMPIALDQPEQTLACDYVIVAIGQAIDSVAFEDSGLPVKRARLVAQNNAALAGAGNEGFFAGGDCVTGPASAVLAVAAGKAAAAAIDGYLGFEHPVTLDTEIPTAHFCTRVYCARANMTEKHIAHLAGNFTQVEEGLKPEEALQEASRCLRCDHFGLGALREGRHLAW